MVEREGFKRLRNVAAVAVLVPAAAFSHGPLNVVTELPGIVFEPAHHLVMDRLPSSEASQDLSFFGQLDNYLETSYGRALASAVVVGSLALLWSARKINSETDTSSQEKLAIFSSIVAISFASVLLAESFGDVNSKVPASLFETYVLSQTALNVWRVVQRHKDLGKRAPAVAIALSLVAISSIPLAETLK